MNTNVVLDSSHVPGRIRKVPIVGWPGLWHWGIEGWRRDVNGQPSMWHSPKGGEVRRTTYAEFSCGQPSEILWTPQTYEQQLSVLQRIKSIQGLPWNLTTANCEQVVRWAVEGKGRSEQLEVGLFAALCAGLVLYFSVGSKA
ncbi:MAG: hypothetical protein ACYDHE_14290 [Candidatus Acidiferrales bacterium]